MSNKYEGYGAISSVYDKINSNVDYVAWADFFEKCFDRHLESRPELVLDLACGTGSLTLDGEDIYGDMDVNHLRKRVGMVFQKPNKKMVIFFVKPRSKPPLLLILKI